MIPGPGADDPTVAGLRQKLRLWIALAILALALVPSAILAVQWRAMPHLGAWHDDAVYWVSAKSLATGGGYRLLNLPGEPPQTKYPPLYPALLALVWRWAPAFPANLPWLMLLTWSMLPVLAALLWVWFRRLGFSVWVTGALTALVVLCPMTTIFATAPLTEIPFVIVVLATLLLIGGDAVSMRNAFLAGLCAAAAVMIRSNGIVLAAAIPIALWRTERSTRLARIAVSLAPVGLAFGGWELWCAMVRTPAANDLLSYYTDYAGFYRLTFSLAALPHRLWLNLDGLLSAVGRLLAWSTSDGIAYRQFCWFLTIFSIAGWRQLWRQGNRGAAWFAILFGGLLVVWNFPPDQRFAYPLLPFAAAGLGIMASQVLSRLPMEWATRRVSNRIAAGTMGALTAGLLCFIVAADVHAYRETLPSWMVEQRARAKDLQPLYEWLTKATSADATIAAYDDPLLYLHTGRHAVSIAVLPALVYEGSDRALAAYVRTTVRDWKRDCVEYVITTAWDFRREFHQTACEAEFIELKTAWKPVLQHETIIVWARKKLPTETEPRASLSNHQGGPT